VDVEVVVGVEAGVAVVGALGFEAARCSALLTSARILVKFGSPGLIPWAGSSATLVICAF
jgi:hypothetical protein